MSHIKIETEVVILLLVVAVAVALLSKRFAIPYVIAIVLVGVVGTTTGLFNPKAIVLSQELLLFIFIPPLLFDGGMRFGLRDLIDNAIPVTAFAVIGFLIAAGITGGLTYLWIARPGVADLGTGSTALLVAMLFGALISATDPVSVIAMFTQLGAPKRLKSIVEGESLFNDGVAVVVFGIVFAVLRGTAHHVGVLGPCWVFLKQSLGGGAIGMALGLLVSWLSRKIDDHMLDITLTLILAYASYFIADHFSVSGVMAVIGAGLMVGTTMEGGRLAPQTGFFLDVFWEYAVFLANSLVFLLVGLRINLIELLSHWAPIAIAIVIITIARVVIVYPLAEITGRMTERIPLSWRHIMVWGGLRGGIAMVLALGLAESTGDRFTPGMASVLRSMTLGIVLFTIVVQGLTIGPLLKKLGLVGQVGHSDASQIRDMLNALGVSTSVLSRMYRTGTISKQAFDVLSAAYDRRIRQYQHAIEAEPGRLMAEAMQIDKVMAAIDQHIGANGERAKKISADDIQKILDDLDIDIQPPEKQA